MKRRSRLTGRPLRLAPPKTAEQLKTTDISQSPDYTVTNTKDNGGLILASVEVAAVFWGKYWSNTSPAPSPTSDTYYQAFTGITTGPYLTGLRQYRGAGPGTMLGKFINDSSDPPNGYGDTDVANMLTKFLDDNPSVPAPATGHQRFYAVVTPPGLNDNEALGKHINFTYKGVKAYYCWVNSIGGLTDSSSDGVVNTFSHELAETCTDPDGGSGITVDGTGVSNDEIGDTCNNEFAIVEMNGVHCNVQCYWSAADKACIMPLGTLSFLINKNTFGKDEVNEAIKVNGGVFSNAFWLALDDYSIDTFNSFKVAIPTPTGPFASLAGVHIKAVTGDAGRSNSCPTDSGLRRSERHKSHPENSVLIRCHLRQSAGDTISVERDHVWLDGDFYDQRSNGSGCKFSGYRGIRISAGRRPLLFEHRSERRLCCFLPEPGFASLLGHPSGVGASGRQLGSHVLGEPEPL